MVLKLKKQSEINMARKTSKYQKERIADERKKAVALYKQGFSTREVSQMLKEMGIDRSHQWVFRVVNEDIPELSTE